MARFITRVELHSASYNDYETLHAAMQQQSFLRVIQASNGIWYHLPTAEYDYSGNKNLSQVLASAKQAANTTGKSYGVIVTESIGSTWEGLVPVS